MAGGLHNEKSVKSRILVVEDNLMNQKLAMFLLQKMGYEAYGVLNGQECLDMLDKQKFDGILMDLQMPVMDGYEATQKIRAGKMKIPVLAVSGNLTEEQINKCKEIGFSDFIEKPLKEKELQILLNTYLMQHEV